MLHTSASVLLVMIAALADTRGGASLVCITGAMATGPRQWPTSYALRAAAIARAEVDPRLVDEVIWWRTDDLWFCALQTLVIYVPPQPNAAPGPPRDLRAARQRATTSSSRR